MGGGRVPHLNLAEDVTTPRRTPGQWEAVAGRDGAERSRGWVARSRLVDSSVAAAERTGACPSPYSRRLHFPDGADCSLSGGGGES